MYTVSLKNNTYTREDLLKIAHDMLAETLKRVSFNIINDVAYF